MLERHPWFEVAWLAASDRSEGRPYAEAARWRLKTAIPPNVAKMTVAAAKPEGAPKIIFAALDSSIARELEPQFAAAGCAVVSNSSALRMQADVPLVIPEVNGDHIQLIESQTWRRKSGGFAVTNPNCSAIGLVMALAPLHRRFTLETVMAVTMQAVSGAGYPGVPSLDILGNVVPFIADEEAKIEREMLKLLGSYEDGEVMSATFKVSAHTNRVPVEHGHTICMTIGFEERPSPESAIETMRSWQGFPATAGLPTRPAHPLVVTEMPDRPQPKRDVNAGNGMTVTVGRVRRDAVLDLRMVALGHNTVRGAAGGSVLNPELLAANGVFDTA